MRSINLSLITGFIVMSFVFAGCSQSSQKEITEEVSELKLSTQIINGYTRQEFDNLMGKLDDASSAEIANRWFPVAEKIQEFTNTTLSRVDSAFKSSDPNKQYKNKDALLQIAKEYEVSLLQLHPELFSSFRHEFPPLIDALHLQDDNIVQSKQVLQAKTHHTISMMANRTTCYANLKTSPGCILTFDTLNVIIGQNSKHLKIGEKLEIIAGIGAFSVAAQPQIVIDDKELSLMEEGYAKFTKVASGVVGRNTVPVTIRYTQPDGSKKTVTKEIEYFVEQ